MMFTNIRKNCFVVLTVSKNDPQIAPYDLSFKYQLASLESAQNSENFSVFIDLSIPYYSSNCVTQKK
jgi:hypothetical protein